MNKQKISIIGSGFSSLSAACYLAQAGYEVNVYEKNPTIGGRARQLKREGFTFDMGPSWYWMPDIFEKFFGDFGKQVSDYYQLEKLDPAYQVVFEDENLVIGSNMEAIGQSFEAIEAGSSEKLKRFMASARKNYDIAINSMVYKPGLSPLELVTPDTMVRVRQFFSTISGIVRKEFSNPKLVATLEFPVLFLGAKPEDTPAFYNFMNYADFGLGTWHPRGGMYEVIKAIGKLAESLGVKIHTNSPVERIEVVNGEAQGIVVNGSLHRSNVVLSGADYHHTETLLPEANRQYSEAYWEKRTFAPSSLLFYIGFDRKIQGVKHHNLFFDSPFSQHAREIYDNPSWPSDPLFYANFPSVTDPTMAPEGMDAGFFLVPIAPGLEDSPELREQYFDIIMDRFEARTGMDCRPFIKFRESFCVNDFKEAYNAYKGNAYGMANTLRQTAFLRPGLRSSKVKSLFFTGQLTVPGPGVPPALISGKLVSGLIQKHLV